MGTGVFAVVPASLSGLENDALFLTSCVSRRSKKKFLTHQISNALCLVADASAWNDGIACHEVEPLLVDALQHTENCICISLSESRLYVVVMQQGNLRLVNYYSVDCVEDTLYYVLNAYKSFGLDVLHDALFVRGMADTAMMRKYIAKVICE